MSENKKQGVYTPPVLEPATPDMWDWLDEYNELQKKRAVDSRELKRYKDGLADAVVAFGKAVKLAQEKIEALERAQENDTEKTMGSDKEFLRKFGKGRYEVSWAKRA